MGGGFYEAKAKVASRSAGCHNGSVAMPDSSTNDVASRLAEAMRRGLPVEDRELDLLLAPELRAASTRWWTPVGVARTVAEWLQYERPSRVLDIGSGAGKLCVAGALYSGLSFTGVEHRQHLVDAACELAARLGVTDQTSFVHASIEAIEIEAFDALYLFNPFSENKYAEEQQLDQSVVLAPERYRRDIEVVERALERAKSGTVVITYHGFGGRIPDTFAPIRNELAGSDVLRMWRKSLAPNRGHWVELDGRVMWTKKR